jgi:hypothetical protein
MTEKTMTKADFYTGLILIVFGITITVLALQMPTVTARGQSPYSAPGLVPAFLGTIITLLSGIMLVRALRRSRFQLGISKESAGGVFREVSTRRMGITILLCTLYAVSLGKVIFPITTFLFIFVFILYFEYDLKESIKSQIRKVLFAGVLAACTSAVVTGVFQYVFLVNLP